MHTLPFPYFTHCFSGVGNPLIRRSHTFAPEMPQRLLGESTAFLKVFFYQTDYRFNVLVIAAKPS